MSDQRSSFISFEPVRIATEGSQSKEGNKLNAAASSFVEHSRKDFVAKSLCLAFLVMLKVNLLCWIGLQIPSSDAKAKDRTKGTHADRTEFHCFRKLVATARAGALGLFAHG